MSLSPDGDQMFIVPFASPKNTFIYNTTFLSVFSCEDIKYDMREKL